jgi:glutamyl-tRNA synthetase
LARLSGGTTLLRIDDNDDARVKTEYLDDIFQTLEFAGLDYETGPSGVADFKHAWSQTLRRPLYEQALESLKQNGDVFACQCSRSKLASTEFTSQHVDLCQNLGLSFDLPDVAWRIKIPDGQKINLTDQIMGSVTIEIDKDPGSFVVRRKDGIASYQIASLIDDMHFGINAVVRGNDLLQSSGMQLFLAEKLYLNQFSRTHFWHHALVANPSGKKLSKSAGDTSIRFFISQGGKVNDIYQGFCHWLNLPSKKVLHHFNQLLEEVGEHFSQRFLF